MRRMLVLAALALAVHAGLAAWAAPARLSLHLAAHGLLVVAMLCAWRAARESARARAIALGAALVFRLVAACGAPVLSDDVYRYVWDGRVQLHGLHPYAHAPQDTALDALRDADSARINHPELRTIYPPLAELAFAVLAALGLGVRGFQLGFGLADFGVVLALDRLLAALELPRERVVLYAWNPLAIVESATSAHVEPLGLLPLVLGTLALARGRRSLSAAALAGAIQAKLVPLVLVPAFVRRFRPREILVLVAVVLALALPYAITGPALGAGARDYAERWEFNALGFACVRGALTALDTGHTLVPLLGAFDAGDRLYRLVWPEPLARLVVLAALAGWIGWVASRRIVDPLREALLVLGALLLLAPTVHPWYALWILPFAAANLSAPWLVFAALVPLAYTGRGGDVSWLVRAVEYGPVLALLGMARVRRPW
jgi:alpha-1,6-mannosyltransferase